MQERNPMVVVFQTRCIWISVLTMTPLDHTPIIGLSRFGVGPKNSYFNKFKGAAGPEDHTFRITALSYSHNEAPWVIALGSRNSTTLPLPTNSFCRPKTWILSCSIWYNPCQLPIRNKFTRHEWANNSEHFYVWRIR